MKHALKLVIAAAAGAVAFVGAARSEAVVGQPAPEFSLRDVSGNVQRLSDYRGKTVVLEWVNPECPFVLKHYGSANIPNLQRAATADGVIWLTINSAHPGGEGDYTPAQMAAWMEKMHGAPTAYLRDQEGKVGRLYAAKTTPHLFVITGDGTLVYDGAIDSIRSAKVGDIARATNYVSAALASVKAGKPVEKPNSQPYGCSVKY
ncbi:MAG: thioredoxin family protein [Verrucomicrobia bacterium]|nr:thioredoxin family protein [Verrucomicrobiota bacterium]